MIKLIQLFLLTLFFSGNVISQIQTIDNNLNSEMTAAQWSEDLHFMVNEMQKVHVNIFHTMTKAELDNAVTALEAKIPKLTNNEMTVELLKIMTMIGDGHTYMIPDYIHMFPVRFYEFEDGVFVTKAHGENSGLVGYRLVCIGNKKWEELREQIKDILPRDNDMWIKSLAPTYAVIGEFMNGLGIINDVNNAEFVFEDESGKRKSVNLISKKVSQREYFRSSHTGDAADASMPLYMQQPEKFYWLKYLDDSKTLFIKYNEVQFDKDESMNAFIGRIDDIVNNNDVKKIVIDIRNNTGGNNFTSIPLSDYLSSNDKINVYGKLYTILGRQTFSAASFFTSSLENKTSTIFVGEPTGATPNHYGDNRPVELPNSKLKPRFSTIYWQNSFPFDKRKFTEPDIPVTLKSSDYFSKRDPVLEAIIAYEPKPVEYPKPDAALKKYFGRYEFSPDQILSIKETSGDMVMEITNFYKTPLYPNGKKLFNTSRKSIVVSFDESTGRDQVVISASGEEYRYTRLPEGKFLASELLEMNRIEEAISVLRELKKSHPDRRSVSEMNINVFGYELIHQKKLDAAIEIFKLNVEFYPDAFNTYDSLGEAYMIAGNNELAVLNYEKSYALNPMNENAKKNGGEAES